MSVMKVALGLSGGVDSAAAALLLKEAGWEVHGFWLDLGFGSPEKAARAAQQLGIPFGVLDIKDKHEALVRAPFAEEYRAGRTPNPCVVCNPSVKLPALWEAAEGIGAEKIATGHYAAIEMRGGRACLRKAGGEKDQSYMLARVGPEMLGRLLLPLAGRTKAETRALAADLGLAAAEEPDSQDICFIPDGDYGAWLEARGLSLPAGDFVDADGRVLGRHRGLHRYTVGQRRGLGVSAESRLYVAELRRETNEILLASREDLDTREVLVRDLNWVSVPERREPFPAEVKLRSGPRKTAALAEPRGDGSLLLRFDAPVRRPAPGQLAAGYEGDLLLFGGTICRD